MTAYPREELEEMVRRWLEANDCAEKERDWGKHLGPFYTEDCEYTWNIGPNEEFVASGRKEVVDLALGYQMEGLDGWTYPYHATLIDDRRGEVLGFWTQVAPHNRPDGSPYKVEGIGGSWFRYAGNYQWSWQRDFFDLGNVKALFFEMAGAGLLSQTMRKKIHTQARGGLLPGHRQLRTGASRLTQLRDGLAMVRIALIG
ncbi:MAG: nuclear transport factor 2 family protein [Polyangiaceae bacterium]